MIIDHDHPVYREKWNSFTHGRWNGAYYYSREIVQNIIPRINTDRNWMTINVPEIGYDHSIVFIHNNKDPGLYSWLKKYDDLILVCGVPQTCENVAHLGKPIYLPLSVDVKKIKKYRSKKSKDIAFVGRRNKRIEFAFPEGTEYVEGLPRGKFLKKMAKYRRVFAVGRVAIEAKILGCQVLPYDYRFPDPSLWKVLDNRDAAKILQKELDKIGG